MQNMHAHDILKFQNYAFIEVPYLSRYNDIFLSIKGRFPVINIIISKAELAK